MTAPKARRTWLLGGVAAVAAAAGATLFMRREPSRRGIDAAGSAGSATPPGSAPLPEDRLWTLSFERPAGGELVMGSLRGRLTLVNFWATWCPPCVKELPMLDRFHRDHAGTGWHVVGLAIDGPTPVRQFLARAPVGFDIGLAGLDGIDLGKLLGNETGALPFTVVLDRQGRVVERKLGELTEDDLLGWVQRHGR
jgi:thiol-disulfide isomerase/thioredoxin